jgi:PAS domain-containing protein
LVERVSEVNDKCASNANALSEIKKELTFNGGQSTKDYLARLESYRRHQFWLQPRPCFECDVHGRNTIVSEAYCLLVNASNEAALLGLNWRQFIYIEDEPTYYASFKTSSDSLSAFRGHIRLSDPDGEYRGQWEVRAVPLLPSSEKTSYVGYLRPLDDIAKALAVDSRWGH